MFEQPEFHVHLGYGGQDLATTAVEDGFADGVVLSPVDYGSSENREIASQVEESGGRVFFDPQFYRPRSQIEELQSHPHFFQFGGDDNTDQKTLTEQDEFDTESFEDAENRRELCEKLIAYQKAIDVDAYISPARFLRSYSDANLRWWRDLIETFQQVAEEEGINKPVFASLPLNGELLQEDDQPGRLLNWVTGVDVDGFYTSLSVNRYHRYPLTGRETIESYLRLIKHLKTSRYEVFLGHSHHIAHLFFGIGADAFASGHYKNLRGLDMDRFEQSDGAQKGQMVINYYSEPLLNELRARSPAQRTSGDSDDEEEEQVDPGDLSDIDLLDVQGFDIENIRSSSPFDNLLFRKGIMTSETDWGKHTGEGLHYLYCCFEISRQYHEENLTSELEKAGDVDTARSLHAWSRIKDAESLYSRIENEGIQLAEPEPAIYSDWPSAFDAVSDQDLE